MPSAAPFSVSSSSVALPVAMAKAALTLLPPPLLERGLAGLVSKMAMRRPRLFRNLAALPKAAILVEPLDVPHKFLLQVGVPRPSVTLYKGLPEKPAATIRASLASLLAMLEGQADGDTLFFARDMAMTGDTAALVSLRNTLDREEIDLAEDLFALTGPFEGAARKAFFWAQRAVRQAHRHAASFHATLHAEDS